MDQSGKDEKMSWGERNGGTIFGLGVFVALGIIILFVRLCG